MDKLPAYFIPHGGGPCFFMEWSPANTWKQMEHYLVSFPAEYLGDIKSILVISAHWEESTVTVTANQNPNLIYDYHGFPPHTYELSWPAAGNPTLAVRIADLLQSADIDCNLDYERGFDHGVFIPLMLSFPSANIPTVQLSLSASLSPKLHLQIGKILEPLRREGVLIVGSGMSFHDVGALMGRRDTNGSKAFNDWLKQAVLSPPEQREQLLINWEDAPNARKCHPREEHLLPLHVIAGTAFEENATLDYSDTVLGAKISAFKFGS